MNVIPHSARDYGECTDPPGYLEQHVWPGYLRELEIARSCSQNVNCKYILILYMQFINLFCSFNWIRREAKTVRKLPYFCNKTDW